MGTPKKLLTCTLKFILLKTRCMRLSIWWNSTILTFFGFRNVKRRKLILGSTIARTYSSVIGTGSTSVGRVRKLRRDIWTHSWGSGRQPLNMVAVQNLLRHMWVGIWILILARDSWNQITNLIKAACDLNNFHQLIQYNIVRNITSLSKNPSIPARSICKV